MIKEFRDFTHARQPRRARSGLRHGLLGVEPVELGGGHFPMQQPNAWLRSVSGAQFQIKPSSDARVTYEGNS